MPANRVVGDSVRSGCARRCYLPIATRRLRQHRKQRARDLSATASALRDHRVQRSFQRLQVAHLVADALQVTLADHPGLLARRLAVLKPQQRVERTSTVTSMSTPVWTECQFGSRLPFGRKLEISARTRGVEGAHVPLASFTVACRSDWGPSEADPLRTQWSGGGAASMTDQAEHVRPSLSKLPWGPRTPRTPSPSRCSKTPTACERTAKAG